MINTETKQKRLERVIDYLENKDDELLVYSKIVLEAYKESPKVHEVEVERLLDILEPEIAYSLKLKKVKMLDEIIGKLTGKPEREEIVNIRNNYLMLNENEEKVDEIIEKY